MATRAAQKEYSDELGSQNDSQMEPKMEPKATTADPHETCASMNGSHVHPIFPTPEKYHQKVNIITPICEPGSKMTPKVPLQAPRQETQIHKKSSKNRL